ncbi:MAG: GNAT family N-acetyltransferase, partial [Bacteroidota bacterium]|nr:GNAT family N-acetyltransferase [Bacteroidota bacterium]
MNSYLAKDGRTFILRQPTASDAAQLIAYSKHVFATTDQLLTTTEEYTMTEEAEASWINSINNSPNSLLLIADFEQSIVGFLFFIGNTKRKTRHTGEFGMSVHQDYRRLGLGQTLLKTLLDWASKNA